MDKTSPAKTYRIGEEVLCHGERHIIAGIDPSRPFPYRLLSTNPSGTHVQWASFEQLSIMQAYLTPHYDTGTVKVIPD